MTKRAEQKQIFELFVNNSIICNACCVLQQFVINNNGAITYRTDTHNTRLSEAIKNTILKSQLKRSKIFITSTFFGANKINIKTSKHPNTIKIETSKTSRCEHHLIQSVQV